MQSEHSLLHPPRLPQDATRAFSNPRQTRSPSSAHIRKRIKIKDGQKLSVKPDQERLIEEGLSLKMENNSFREENLRLKTRINQLDHEIAKRDEFLDELRSQAGEKHYYVTLKQGHLVSSLKQTVKDLRNELKTKEDELAKLRKTVKLTQIAEIEAELEAYVEECARLKKLLVESARPISRGRMANSIDQAQGQIITKLNKEKLALEKNLMSLQEELARSKQRDHTPVKEPKDAAVLQAEISKVREDLSTKGKTLSQAEEKLRQQAVAMKEMQDRLQTVTRERDSLQQRNEEVAESLQELQERLAVAESRELQGALHFFVNKLASKKLSFLRLLQTFPASGTFQDLVQRIEDARIIIPEQYWSVLCKHYLNSRGAVDCPRLMHDVEPIKARVRDPAFRYISKKDTDKTKNSEMFDSPLRAERNSFGSRDGIASQIRCEENIEDDEEDDSAELRANHSEVITKRDMAEGAGGVEQILDSDELREEDPEEILSKRESFARKKTSTAVKSIESEASSILEEQKSSKETPCETENPPEGAFIDEISSVPERQIATKREEMEDTSQRFEESPKGGMGCSESRVFSRKSLHHVDSRQSSHSESREAKMSAAPIDFAKENNSQKDSQERSPRVFQFVSSKPSQTASFRESSQVSERFQEKKSEESSQERVLSRRDEPSSSDSSQKSLQRPESSYSESQNAHSEVESEGEEGKTGEDEYEDEWDQREGQYSSSKSERSPSKSPKNEEILLPADDEIPIEDSGVGFEPISVKPYGEESEEETPRHSVFPLESEPEEKEDAVLPAQEVFQPFLDEPMTIQPLGSDFGMFRSSKEIIESFRDEKQAEDEGDFEAQEEPSVEESLRKEGMKLTESEVEAKAPSPRSSSSSSKGGVRSSHLSTPLEEAPPQTELPLFALASEVEKNEGSQKASSETPSEEWFGAEEGDPKDSEEINEGLESAPRVGEEVKDEETSLPQEQEVSPRATEEKQLEETNPRLSMNPELSADLTPLPPPEDAFAFSVSPTSNERDQYEESDDGESQIEEADQMQMLDIAQYQLEASGSESLQAADFAENSPERLLSPAILEIDAPTAKVRSSRSSISEQAGKEPEAVEGAEEAAGQAEKSSMKAESPSEEVGEVAEELKAKAEVSFQQPAIASEEVAKGPIVDYQSLEGEKGASSESDRKFSVGEVDEEANAAPQNVAERTERPSTPDALIAKTKENIEAVAVRLKMHNKSVREVFDEADGWIAPADFLFGLRRLGLRDVPPDEFQLMVLSLGGNDSGEVDIGELESVLSVYGVRATRTGEAKGVSSLSGSMRVCSNLSATGSVVEAVQGRSELLGQISAQDVMTSEAEDSRVSGNSESFYEYAGESFSQQSSQR